LDYQFERARLNHTEDGVFDDIGYLNEVCPLLDGIRSPVQFDRYVDKVAQTLGNVRVDSVRQEVERWRRSGGKRKESRRDHHSMAATSTTSIDEFEEVDAVREKTQVSNEELTLLALLSEHRELYNNMAFVPASYEFNDARVGGFPAQVLTLAENGELVSSRLMEIAAGFETDGQGLEDKLAKLYISQPEQYVFSRVVEDANRLAARIRLDYLQMRRDWLNRQLDAIRNDAVEADQGDVQAWQMERDDVSRRVIELRRQIESKRPHSPNRSG